MKKEELMKVLYESRKEGAYRDCVGFDMDKFKSGEVRVTFHWSDYGNDEIEIAEDRLGMRIDEGIYLSNEDVRKAVCEGVLECFKEKTCREDLYVEDVDEYVSCICSKK